VLDFQGFCGQRFCQRSVNGVFLGIENQALIGNGLVNTFAKNVDKPYFGVNPLSLWETMLP
jgi:hypothetical protein